MRQAALPLHDVISDATGPSWMSPAVGNRPADQNAVVEMVAPVVIATALSAALWSVDTAETESHI